MAVLRLRRHGAAGPRVVLVHGGPGAPGYMASLAVELADAFRVLEPFQRPSGGPPLTVARHVADLQERIEAECAGEPPLVVGHSWGAMLALAHAAEHPRSVAGLALVGCGTFDREARARFRTSVEGRMDAGVRAALERIALEVQDEDERLRSEADAVLPLYSVDPLPGAELVGEVDARAHRESWDDMLARQADGTYPAAFAAIDAPVLMLHGAEDPHPGERIRAGLAPLLPQLEYREWRRCGHYPWLERAARAEFLECLRAWLARAARGARALEAGEDEALEEGSGRGPHRKRPDPR